MSMSLPAGSHYAATWGIPDDYAGMTNALLHRSRAFVRLTGAQITVLTYEYREGGYDPIRARLIERSHFIDGMALRNLWEDLAGFDGETLRGATAFDPAHVDQYFTPLSGRDDLGDDVVKRGPGRHQLDRADGSVRQVDYFRPDGTLFVSDRRDVEADRPRWITLCDETGEPIGTSHQIWALYWFWLDQLPRDPRAWIICDSKTSANHLVDYRRDDVVTLHVIHGSHLAPGSEPSHGELTPSRARVLKRLDQWSGAVFLTQDQLDDVETVVGHGTNRFVVPNGRDTPPELPKGPRERRRGVMLTSLTGRKQIPHAIEAAGLASTWRRRTIVDVYGQGHLHKKLKRVAATQKRASVTLRGYDEHAVAQFEAASFSLLTSDNEAFGLVLVESMGRGCIPISYDMPYGPSDIITHGVNGFLVPRNDIEQLGRVIRSVVQMSTADLDVLRTAAHARAQDFSDEHVTDRWIDVMQQVLDQQPALA